MQRFHLSVKSKMILIFAVLLPGLIGLLGLWVHTWIFNYTLELIVDTKFKTDISIASEIAALKTRDEQLSDQILLNPVVQDAFSNAYTTALEKYYVYQNVQGTLSGIVDGGATGAYLIKSDKTIYRSDDNMQNIAVYGKEFLELCISNAHKGRGQNIMFSAQGNPFAILAEAKKAAAHKSYVYVVREVRSGSRALMPTGYSVLQTDYQRYKNILMRNISSEGEFAFMVQNGENVLVSTNDGEIPKENLTGFINGTNINETGYIFDKEKGQVVLSIANPKAQISVVHIIPTDNINKSLNQLSVFIWSSLLTSFIMLTLILWRFSSTLFKPISQLAVQMRRFGDGERDVRIQSTRNDEIGTLEKQFNHMADDVNRYMNEINKEHEKQTKLELMVLENQINPHFLYNTLDLINWRLRRAKQDEIANMVNMLAQFFRIGLHGGAEYITLEKEIEHAKLYLGICRIRYGGGFEFEINADESIMKCKVKKLILQPILENAIIHGLNGNIKNGTVKVNARQNGKYIIIDIADDGRGMSEEALLHINQLLAQNEISSDDSFGLQNINRRISLAYGEGCGITIISSEGTGTCVSVRLLRKEEI